MLETSFSLLERLRLSSDSAAWQRLVELYTPYIQSWLRRQNVQPADVEDLTQEVLRSVVGALPNFQHDLRRGAFRRWLRTITVNHLRSFCAPAGRKRSRRKPSNSSTASKTRPAISVACGMRNTTATSFAAFWNASNPISSRPPGAPFNW